nr:reverse transcriptase domain-containing protein [Tanacetum cinerariifolium]
MRTRVEFEVEDEDEANTASSSGSGTLPGTKVTKDQVQTPCSQNTAPIQPTIIQSESQAPVSEPVVASVSALMPNLKPFIPYPSRRDNKKCRDQANEQIKKFCEIFKEMSFEISFTDALILMPKFASTLKALIGNKEKLSEMARITMNEHCSAVILNKLPRKLGDPRKFLIPCEFSGMDECLALADLGASINLMPLLVWEGLSLPELTPTCMTLELANRSVYKPIGIAKDVSFKVGVFHFLADFVGELTLRIGNEAITYNLDQTVRYSANYNQITANKIDVIESACEEYSQEVLDFSNVTTIGTPTPHNDPIVSTTSPTLTLFGDSDFLLFEEADAFLSPKDDPDSLKINPFYYDPEGDILLSKAILNTAQNTTSTPMNEHCSAVILNKLPKKLGDPRKFLIPCEFRVMDECLALADLGASINLMPLSMWKGLLLPELTSTCMTLKLADRTESKLVSIAKDVKVKVGMFHLPADFVVVDFEPDPPSSLNSRAVFLKDQSSSDRSNYDQMTTNKIDVADEACEEYSQEVLGFSDVTTSSSPTPSDDPIVSTTSPTLTLFGDSDFLLFKEADAFLGLEDDPDSPELDPSYYDPKGDILSLEAILNSDPSPPLPNHEKPVPSFKEEMKACEAKMIKSSIDEPHEVELKDLPPHLEYAFLEGDNKLPVIIAKALRDEEKSALIKVLKFYKRAIAWKLSDIQGINPKFCTHKILMEENYKPVVQNQRRVNPEIHDVIKKEVEKLLDAGLIYSIFDSPWVSSVHCVPKKGGFTVVANEENELIPTRLVTR